MEGRQSHPCTPISYDFIPKRGKKRGGYNCGRCGLPKNGHICNSNNPTTELVVPTPTLNDAKSIVSPSPLSVIRPQPPRQPVVPQLRRALSFDDDDIGVSDESPGSDVDDDDDVDLLDLGGSGKLPGNCLWEVLKRLPPSELLSSAKVCKGWRDVCTRIWKSAQELRLGVPLKTHIGVVRSVLKKCPRLVKLSLTMKRDELGRFLADKRCLTNLKMEGCSNLGGFTLSSTSLSSLCLSDLFCHSKMVFNCPNLKEICLDFSRQENVSTDLTAMVGGLGRSCARLQNIHVASVRLTHAVVLALTAANLRYLEYPSTKFICYCFEFRGIKNAFPVLGSEITDASVAAIASSYSRLEFLDLSGSSISDSGIGMICNVFPETLSKLLLALCPNITSSGIQFAAAQLPNLELMGCGISICDPDLDSPTTQENDNGELQRTPSSKLHLIYQKLIIKHSRLKKISLWPYI